MKIAEILARVDDEKLNQYDARVKTAWLSEVEGMVVDEILNMAEGNDIWIYRRRPVRTVGGAGKIQSVGGSSWKI